MGFLWDLVQQSQISAQEQRNTSLEQRVAMLESELRRTQELLRTLIQRLEAHTGADLNQDGRVG
jgi:uncharacterized coiled-coil protein SlyX